MVSLVGLGANNRKTCVKNGLAQTYLSYSCHKNPKNVFVGRDMKRRTHRHTETLACFQSAILFFIVHTAGCGHNNLIHQIVLGAFNLALVLNLSITSEMKA